MTRVQILVLSVIDCVFGVLSLWGPESMFTVSRIINGVLAVALIFIAGADLKARGWRFGQIIGLTYVFPLVGLVTYLALSDRAKAEPAAV